MHNLKELIKKIFTQKKILNIALISDEPENCNILYNCLNNIFDTNDNFLNEIKNVLFKQKNNNFSILVNDKIEIHFIINFYESDFKNINEIAINNDILIPIIRLNKYTNIEYDQTVHTIDYILSSIFSTKKSFICSFFYTEYIINESIEDEHQWQKFINNLYHLFINKLFKPEIEFTKQGDDIILGLFKNLKFIYKFKQILIPQQLNFFVNDDLKKIKYGQNEFIANLVLKLISFDKFNSYYYIYDQTI